MDPLIYPRMNPSNREVTMPIKQGDVSGLKQVSHNGNVYWSFRGIPYAKLPINELKFKAPLPAEKWSGTFKAYAEGPDCFHVNGKTGTLGGSEDCLRLNVYTPHLTVNELMPVMVWIHGAGMFKCGSSHSDYYGPEVLMSHGVVLVTFNYRLGISGFLNLEDESLGVTGNAGLKDMVMALQWVKENIEEFGGDPSNVTIAGQGAGAAAAHLLVLSKMAEGLFDKAIVQSGSALCPWVWSENVEHQREVSAKVTQKLCSILNIARGNERELLARLQTMDFRDLHDLEQQIPDNVHMATFRNFGPIIEKNVPGAFLSRKPIDIILSGDYNHVPMIMGFNNLDGAIVNPWLLDNIKLDDSWLNVCRDVSLIEEYWKTIVPHTLHEYLDSRSQDKLVMLGRVIMERYSANSFRRYLYEFHTDNMFARDIIFSAEFHAKTTQCPVYFYKMSLETDLNLIKHKAESKYRQIGRGACFGDDIYYLFSTKETHPLPLPDTPEGESQATISRIWTDFMKYSDPNAAVTDRKWFWTPISRTEFTYLNIHGDRSTGIKLTSGFRPAEEKMKLWRIIYQLDPTHAKLFAKGLQTAKHLQAQRHRDEGAEGDESEEEDGEEEDEFDDADQRYSKVIEQIEEYRNSLREERGE